MDLILQPTLLDTVPLPLGYAPRGGSSRCRHSLHTLAAYVGTWQPSHTVRKPLHETKATALLCCHLDTIEAPHSHQSRWNLLIPLPPWQHIITPPPPTHLNYTSILAWHSLTSRLNPFSGKHHSLSSNPPSPLPPARNPLLQTSP